MSDHFYVVTGGPGAGKTSLITELARRGFHAIPESGRAIIREEIDNGGDALPWVDRISYAERMLERAQRRRGALGPSDLRRRHSDVMGYLTLCGLAVPSHAVTVAKTARYNARVFLASHWDEIFTQDAERKQTRADADATCAAMSETYAALGYETTELPRADIATRANFVCAQLANPNL